MLEWHTYFLKDIATFSQGIQVDTDNQFIKKEKGLIRFIRIIDYSKTNEPPRYILYPKDSYIVNTNDIVMIRYGSQTAGKVVRGISGAIANNMFKITLNNDVITNEYAYYYLSQASVFNHLRGAQSSSTMPAITFELVGRQLIILPDIFTQKRITTILSCLDQKIELNRRINENLEQQAQALFKSWFVDFEPFKNGKFVDSELGMIPEELNIRYIGDIPHTIECGRRPKGGATDKGVPSIGAENIKGLGIYDYSKTKYIPKEFALTTNRGKINGYELLIYKDGGKPGYFIPNYTIFGDGFPFENMFINEHVFKLDLLNKEYNIFAYFYMQTPFIMNQLNSIGGKAAIPGINTKDVESLPIFSYENNKIKEFGKIVLPMIKRILKNCRENSRLAQLRDTLLPKLMSGELKLSEIETKLDE